MISLFYNVIWYILYNVKKSKLSLGKLDFFSLQLFLPAGIYSQRLLIVSEYSIYSVQGESLIFFIHELSLIPDQEVVVDEAKGWSLLILCTARFITLNCSPGKRYRIMKLLLSLFWRVRLRAEVEEWRSKSGKMQMELNQLKAQYKGMEMKVSR